MCSENETRRISMAHMHGGAAGDAVHQRIEALVAAVQGTVVEDGRDALAQVADLLHRCVDAASWEDCRVGLYEMEAIIDEVKTGSYDQI